MSRSLAAYAAVDPATVTITRFATDERIARTLGRRTEEARRA